MPIWLEVLYEPTRQKYLNQLKSTFESTFSTRGDNNQTKHLGSNIYINTINTYIDHKEKQFSAISNQRSFGIDTMKSRPTYRGKSLIRDAN